MADSMALSEDTASLMHGMKHIKWQFFTISPEDYGRYDTSEVVKVISTFRKGGSSSWQSL